MRGAPGLVDGVYSGRRGGGRGDGELEARSRWCWRVILVVVMVVGRGGLVVLVWWEV